MNHSWGGGQALVQKQLTSVGLGIIQFIYWGPPQEMSNLYQPQFIQLTVLHGVSQGTTGVKPDNSAQLAKNRMAHMLSWCKTKFTVNCCHHLSFTYIITGQLRELLKV